MNRVIWVDDEKGTGLLVDQLAKYLKPLLPGCSVEWWKDAAMVTSQTIVEDGTCFVLDHRWKGAVVDSMVDRIFRLNPDSRVIVCTGKDLDPSDLITLGRLGVFTYWIKPIDVTAAGRVIVDVCLSPTATLNSLRREALMNSFIDRATVLQREFTSLKA